VPASARRKLKPARTSDRVTRSLRALERTASTSRVLNLIAIAAESGHRPEYLQAPLFKNRVLNTALIVKHRVRYDEIYLFEEARTTATKIIIPFDRRDLALGGQSVFVGQRGWAELLRDACNGASESPRDLSVLQMIDGLPSLDPFLLREHLRRHGVFAAPCYFALSPADVDAMQGFVSVEIARLIALAYRDMGGGGDVHAARLVEALLATDVDERLEPLRDTLALEGDSFKEGVFSWKGFLYYKWVLESLWPKLAEVGAEIGRLAIFGARDPETGRYLEEARRRLQAGVLVERNAILRTLQVYDSAFNSLVEKNNPRTFRDFLIRAPELFLNLGERVGAISHISSYWRYRFRPGQPLNASVQEALDIFMDFEAGLSVALMD
jgi:hypothetical protein